MKFIIGSLCLAAVLAFAFADSDAAHFMPKAFYTLDSNGHKSNVHAVNPHTANYLRRLRREVISSSVTTSSSSFTDSNGITHFTSQTVNSHLPQADISSRFSNANEGQTTGHVVQTTGVITGNGKVYYKTHEDHF